MNRPPFGQGHESLLHIHLICSGTADPADFSTRSFSVGELVSVNYGTDPLSAHSCTSTRRVYM